MKHSEDSNDVLLSTAKCTQTIPKQGQYNARNVSWMCRDIFTGKNSFKIPEQIEIHKARIDLKILVKLGSGTPPQVCFKSNSIRTITNSILLFCLPNDDLIRMLCSPRRMCTIIKNTSRMYSKIWICLSAMHQQLNWFLFRKKFKYCDGVRCFKF